MKKLKPEEKKTIIRVIMFIAAIAMILSFVLLPLAQTIGAEEVTDVTVTSFETGSLSSAIDMAKDGTDLNNVSSISVSGGTLNDADYQAICGYPDIVLLDLSGADTKDGKIPDNALSSRNKLESVYLPKNTVSIGSNAFSRDRTITTLMMPSSVRSIGDGAFEGCEGMTRFDIPAEAESIGARAFYDCKALSEFVVPAGITEIPEACFAQTALTSLILGPQVTEIGSRAFENCHDLTDIYFYGDAPSLGEATFQNCKITVHAKDGAKGFEDMQAAASNWVTLSFDLTGEYTAPKSDNAAPAPENDTSPDTAPADTAPTETTPEDTASVDDASEETVLTTASQSEEPSRWMEPAPKDDGMPSRWMVTTSPLVLIIIVVLSIAVGVLGVLAFRKKK